MDARALVLVAALGGAGTGCAAEQGAAELTGLSSAPVLGAEDYDAQFSGVLGVMTLKGDLVARCTGVLVAPDLMLTARHCVAFDDGAIVTCGQSSLGAAVTPSNVLATAEATASVDDRSGYVEAVEIAFAPGGDDTCGFDFAAVRLAGLPPGAHALYPPRLAEPVSAGETFTAVGFGSTGGTDVGIRRYLLNANALCAGEECALAEVQESEWLAEDGTFCRADSGAPAIDSEDRLIGVVSRGQNPCASPILAAMPPWADWLREVARAAAMAGGYDVPSWAASNATPTADAGPAAMPEQPSQPRLQNTCAYSPARTGSAALGWIVALWIARRRRRN